MELCEQGSTSPDEKKGSVYTVNMSLLNGFGFGLGVELCPGLW